MKKTKVDFEQLLAVGFVKMIIKLYPLKLKLHVQQENLTMISILVLVTVVISKVSAK